MLCWLHHPVAKRVQRDPAEGAAPPCLSHQTSAAAAASCYPSAAACGVVLLMSWKAAHGWLAAATAQAAGIDFVRLAPVWVLCISRAYCCYAIMHCKGCWLHLPCTHCTHKLDVVAHTAEGRHGAARSPAYSHYVRAESCLRMAGACLVGWVAQARHVAERSLADSVVGLCHLLRRVCAAEHVQTCVTVERQCVLCGGKSVQRLHALVELLVVAARISRR